MSNLETAIEYATNILNGTIPACIYIKQSVQRFLNDLDNPAYFYDADAADTIVNFCESFDLTEVSPPTKLKLHPFQIFVIVNLYGIYRKDTLTKKYRTAYLELGRGNGKTQLIILLSLYELLFGTDSQIILAADTTKQVLEVDFDKAKKLVHQIDPNEKYIKVYYNKIIYKNNKLIVTSNESKPIDGLSGSYMVVDEMHLMKDLSVYNSLKSSMVKRTDNILFIITTAGNDRNSECFKMRTYCTNVLAGKYEDNSQFAMIFTIDEKDDYLQEINWYKPNPLLGVSVNKEAIASEVIKSKQNEIEKASILQRHFNVWIKDNEQDLFIQTKYVEAALADISIDSPDFKGCEIIVGADLSVNDDITSVTYLTKKDGLYYFFNNYYICSEALTTKRNKERYKEAAARGEIKIIEGTAIDYDIIVNDLNKRNKTNPIKLIAFDNYNAKDFIKQLEKEGYYMIRVSQLASGLNAPLKELQRLFLLSKVQLQRNSITSWMFGNVVIKTGYTGLICLDKTNSDSNKIDGVASITDAMAGYLIAPDYDVNIF